MGVDGSMFDGVFKLAIVGMVALALVALAAVAALGYWIFSMVTG